MGAHVNRHKGEKKRIVSELRGREIHAMQDEAFLMRRTDNTFRRQDQLQRLKELIDLPDIPPELRTKFRDWQLFLVNAGPLATLSAIDADMLRRKHFRFVVKGNEPIPEGWKPKPKQFRRYEKPPMAPFLRDPSLLPKKPPGR